MGFWHTTVGKFIHHSTGGLVGPNIKHGPKPAQNYPGATPADIPKECNTDIDYFVKHQDLCWQHTTSPFVPPIPEVGPGTGTVLTPPSGPVSAVPEPSSIALFVTAMVVVGLFRGFRRGN